MEPNRLHPVLRFVASGVLSVILAVGWNWPAMRDVRWSIIQGGIAAAAFLVLIPVLVRGDSWQKMLAGIMLFLPAFFLLMAIATVGSRL